MLYQKNSVLINPYEISLEDRGFMYGDGCFTTARWANGEIQLWQRHQQRFKQAITALDLKCDLDQIEQQAEIFKQYLNDHPYGTIKIVLSRGMSERGYALPQQNCDIYFYFYPTQPLTFPTTLASIGILQEPLGSQMQRLKGVKTLNRLEQVMLKAQAQTMGWQDGLCFDQNMHLVEAISSNCFLYINGIWVTPNLSLTGIEGTMRKEMISRLEYYQIPHQIRMITQAEIAQAQAVFLCNALQPMQMIQQILDVNGEGYSLQLQPCQQLFHALSLHQLV